MKPWFLLLLVSQVEALVKVFENPEWKRCYLPKWAGWCQVHILGFSSPFFIAVHLASDRLSEQVCTRGYFDIRSLDEWRAIYGDDMLSPPSTDAERKVVLDIGAHIGFVTILWAMIGHNVIAIEANPLSTDLLRSSICRNNLKDRVQVHTFALSRFVPSASTKCVLQTDPTEPLKRPDGEPYFFYCRLQLCCPPTCKQLVEILWDIKVTTLTDLLATHHPRLGPIDLVKLDIEGHECEVLRDADTFWLNYAPKRIMTEVWGAWKYKESRIHHPLHNCTKGFYLRLLQKHGYRVVGENWVNSWMSDVYLERLQ